MADDFGNKKAACNTEPMMVVLNARDVQSGCTGESGKRKSSKVEHSLPEGRYKASGKEDSTEKARKPHQ